MNASARRAIDYAVATILNGESSGPKTRAVMSRISEHAPVDPEARDLIDSVRAANLTFLSRSALLDLHRVVRRAESEGVDGLLVEAGSALGGSAIVMAASKEPRRKMRLFDVFEMIPPPSERDGEDVHERYTEISSGRASGLGGNTEYYGYMENLVEVVRKNFERFVGPVEDINTEFVKGLFQETMHFEEPVAVAHIDGDWYDSTMSALVSLHGHMSPGGRIVVDDYDSWSGCRDAVRDFVRRNSGYRVVSRSRLHLVAV